MNNIPSVIKGGSHSDHRGTISFVNDFDMSQVKRFYVIQNKDNTTIRAWRGHATEQRWFSVVHGEFLIRLVKIDDWQNPSKDLPVKEYLLSAENSGVLHIPMGYASWVKAVKDHSKLIVFADYGIEHAKEDDYLFPEDHFKLKT